MRGTLRGLYRYPIKGFTAEPVARAHIATGGGLPGDRIYALEVGDSGFDPSRPAFIPKQRLAVLASRPEVALFRTRYRDESCEVAATFDQRDHFVGSLADTSGRARFASWVGERLHPSHPKDLSVLTPPEGWRFTDHARGAVSIINLASVADLSRRMGIQLDPLRFRANLYVDGWPAWAEEGWVSHTLRVGAARLSIFKATVRCAATAVNPTTAERDADVLAALHGAFGRLTCGVYAETEVGGLVEEGDVCELAPEPLHV